MQRVDRGCRHLHDREQDKAHRHQIDEIALLAHRDRKLLIAAIQQWNADTRAHAANPGRQHKQQEPEQAGIEAGDQRDMHPYLP